MMAAPLMCHHQVVRGWQQRNLQVQQQRVMMMMMVVVVLVVMQCCLSHEPQQDEHQGAECSAPPAAKGKWPGNRELLSIPSPAHLMRYCLTACWRQRPRLTSTKMCQDGLNLQLTIIHLLRYRGDRHGTISIELCEQRDMKHTRYHRCAAQVAA